MWLLYHFSRSLVTSSFKMQYSCIRYRRRKLYLTLLSKWHRWPTRIGWFLSAVESNRRPVKAIHSHILHHITAAWKRVWKVNCSIIIDTYNPILFWKVISKRRNNTNGKCNRYRDSLCDEIRTKRRTRDVQP